MLMSEETVSILGLTVLVRVSPLDRVAEAGEARGGERLTRLPTGTLLLSQGHPVWRGLWETRKTPLHR